MHCKLLWSCRSKGNFRYHILMRQKLQEVLHKQWSHKQPIKKRLLDWHCFMPAMSGTNQILRWKELALCHLGPVLFLLAMIYKFIFEEKYFFIRQMMTGISLISYLCGPCSSTLWLSSEWCAPVPRHSWSTTSTFAIVVLRDAVKIILKSFMGNEVTNKPFKEDI